MTERSDFQLQTASKLVRGGNPLAMPAILHFNLHREFFAQIAAGTKRIEYRRRTIFWHRRLEGRHYDGIQSRNESPRQRAAALPHRPACRVVVSQSGTKTERHLAAP